MLNTDPQETVDITASESRSARLETVPEAPLQYDTRFYELSEELGKGGMGEVYRAGDPSLGRDLAIKVMKAELCGHAEIESRFLREARITGSLQHPGIVAVHNLGRLADGRLHYTMRLVRGRTFADILKDTAGQPEQLPYLLTIFEKICQAVAYAHSKRVLHRDLKPGNVMVGKFGEVQVMDWGLAKVLTSEGVSAGGEQRMETEATAIPTDALNTPADLTQSGSSMGTPAYMSPEQALGELDMVDERTDVFALGSILCILLTGQPAYSGRDGGEVLRRARRGDLSEAHARLEKCGADESLRTLCRECLTADCAQRPRDAAVVAQRIADYQVAVQERLRRAEIERVAAETRAQAELARAAVEAERAQEAQARARAERRARRRTLALSLSVVAILCLGSGGGWWIASERKARADEMIARLEADGRAGEARSYYMRGEILYYKDRYTEAIAEYRKAVELQPDNGEYWFTLAERFYHEKKWDEAITAYEAVIRLKPDNAVAHKNLGDALKKTGQKDRAILAYREALRLEPDYAEAHDSLGFLLEAKGQWEEALAEYREAVRLKPNDAGFHIDLGDALQNKGRSEEAIAQFREAIRLEPDNADAHNSLGDLLEDKGQWEEAIAEYREAVRLKPNDGLFHMDLGIALRKKGLLDEAIAEHRQAIRFRPDYARAHHYLGIALYDKGKYDEAIKAHVEAIRLKSDNADFHYELGLALYDKGQFDEAIAAFREGIRLAPGDARLHNNLGNALWKQGELDEALAQYQEAIRLKPNYANPHNGVGNVLNDKGRPYEAILQYRQAIRLEPTPVFHTNLGNTLRKKGDWKDAVAEYREALRLKTDHAPAQYGLRKCEKYLALEGALLGALQGQELPANPVDTIAVAEMCGYREHFDTAARLCSAAFTADPKLAAGSEYGHRYDAACYGVMAAAVEDGGGRRVPDKVAAMFRRWALAWLRSLLNSYVQLAEQKAPTARQTVRQNLAIWRRDPHLASVRDPAALERLPDNERAAWQELWHDMEQLANRVKSTP